MWPITLSTDLSRSLRFGDVVTEELADVVAVSGLLLCNVEVERDSLLEPLLPLLPSNSVVDTMETVEG